MIRNTFIFLGSLVAGALIALVVRAAAFNPHTDHKGHPATAEYAPMVTNSLVPGPNGSKKVEVAMPNAMDPHAGHTATTVAASEKPVNTVCAICGMDVDPKLPTLEYQGKKFGFGCKMCPPKFKADPDRYGPYYLRNEIIKK